MVGILTTGPSSWLQTLAELDERLREMTALRKEIAVLRQRIADLTSDRDTWRSRREGNW